ncbi:MAG: ABC transporter permease [Thermoleophilia bacterium]
MASVAPDLPDALGVPPGGGAVRRSPRGLVWARLRRDRGAQIGGAIIVAVALLAILADVIARIVGHPVDELYPTQTDDFGVPLGPTGDFVFGADPAGRDLFVRVLYGARTSLLIAAVATGVSLVVGVALGVLAGYLGRWVDTVISRLTDVVLAMPLFLLAIGVVAACGVRGCLGGAVEPGRSLVVFVVALFSWPYIARVVRGQTIALREQAFVEASRSLGASSLRIMTRELLPNLAAPIAVLATLLIPSTIVFEASLSFLGLGLPDAVPSWGRMLSDATQWYDVAWWTLAFPGAFLLVTVLAFNLLGDALRDAVDPRGGR